MDVVRADNSLLGRELSAGRSRPKGAAGADGAGGGAGEGSSRGRGGPRGSGGVGSVRNSGRGRASRIASAGNPMDSTSRPQRRSGGASDGTPSVGISIKFLVSNDVAGLVIGERGNMMLFYFEMNR
jgi:hypothetical protein